MIDHVAIVVPAHNEEAEILGCLTALTAAVDRAFAGQAATPPSDASRPAAARPAGARPAGAQPALRSVRIIAVADDCTDDTPALLEAFAARHPVVTPIAVPYGAVGRARDAGAQAALTAIGEADPDPGALARTWLAFTDADSRVPPNWITAHLDHAGRGADCVVGTVEPRADGGNDGLLGAWFAMHRLGEDHDHVFGANLGIRGSVYERIGGCPPLRLGEDVAMVSAVTAIGGTVRRTDDCRVVTSARMHGRCHGGFSTYLHELRHDRLGEVGAEESRAG